jgi:hypothetical protein
MATQRAAVLPWKPFSMAYNIEGKAHSLSTVLIGGCNDNDGTIDRSIERTGSASICMYKIQQESIYILMPRRIKTPV